MKMYIILLNNIPDRLAPVISAHASLACYKKFQTNESMVKWISGIFRKVVCVVDEKEFDKLKNETDYVLLTESSLNNQEVCLAFCPREEFPKLFKYLRMWKPQNTDGD